MRSFFRVKTEEESIAVQETLLNAGFVWLDGDTEVKTFPYVIRFIVLHDKDIMYSIGDAPAGGSLSLYTLAERMTPSESLARILQRKTQKKEKVVDKTKETKKITKKSTKDLVPIYRPRNLDNVVKRVKKFYDGRGVYTSPFLYENIMEAYVAKKKAMAPIFGSATTMQIRMEGTKEKWKAFSASDLGHKALSALVKANIQVEPLDVINNKVQVGKQTMKLTRWLLKNASGWDENSLGELYNGLQLGEVSISIDPYEFQTASENCGWYSCFRVYGEYHCSVWAYYQNRFSTVLKIKNSNGIATFRVFIVFDLDKGHIYFGRTYGSLDSGIYKIIRTKLEKLVADYLGFENRWVVLRGCTPENDYDNDNTYLDRLSYQATPKHIHQKVGHSEGYLQLPSGWCSSGCNSGSGSFTRTTCVKCGRSTYDYVVDYENDDEYLCPECGEGL